MLPPSKYLFELTKQKKKTTEKKKNGEAYQDYAHGHVAFFLQLPPGRVPERTACYHTRIRIKTTREHI